tara:strand:+ start:5401 stop:6060 length:660 start_codon:yes stop_codon:yes gene_type:complete
MANIIDATYFERGSLYIPNNKDLTVQPTGSPSVVTELDSFIVIYERQLMLNALGVTLYDELVIALDDLDNAGNLKWKNLVEGIKYTNVDGKVKVWDGLKGYNGQSLIAYYIFTEYLRNDNETYATVGVVKNNAKNAEVVNPTPKFIKAYNQFIKFYQGEYNSSGPRIIVNGFGSIGMDWYNETAQVSLYNYITDANDLDATNFPDFEFRVYENLNSLGI